VIVAMRFAILGDHPDGWSMARALIASGRHMVLAYQGPTPEQKLRPDWPVLRVSTDLEEILADPQIEAVIVAGRPGERLDQLRRVLQSERPALCVHPVDHRPDGAYEMNMLQGDVHQVVLPILTEAVHPAIDELRRRHLDPPAQPRLVELVFAGPEDFLFESSELESRPRFPGWTLLRRLGGEIVEVSGFAVAEEVTTGNVVLVQGRFESGCLLTVRYIPQPCQSRGTEVVIHTEGREPTRTALADAPTDDVVWQSLIVRFEEAVGELKSLPRAFPGAGPAAGQADTLSWQDEIRALELDDSTRRSIERRRAYALEFQDASEDVGFKGTMTLVGCALLWLIPVLFVAAAWFPQIGWLIVPVLVGFLGLQLLRWLVPAPPQPPGSQPPEDSG
jgi:hypothetical protein